MKGAIYYEAIATMKFSHVKTSSFHAKAPAPGISLVFIIIKMGSRCSMYGQTLSLVYPPVSHVVFDKQDVQQQCLIVKMKSKRRRDYNLLLCIEEPQP